MAGEAPSRWQRAVRDTHGFKDWKRGVSAAGSSGLAVFAGLELSGSPDAMNTVWILLLSMSGAFVVRPVVEFGWNYLWTPWRVLNENVTQLVEKAETPKQISVDPVMEAKGKQARLELLRRLENELRGMSRGASQALEKQSIYSFTATTTEWDTFGPKLGGIHHWQRLYEVLRETYEVVNETRLERMSIEGLSDSNRDALSNVAEHLAKALKAVRAEIKREVGE